MKKQFLLVLVLPVLTFFTVSCEQKSDAEKAAEEIGDAVEEVADEVDDVVDEAN